MTADSPHILGSLSAMSSKRWLGGATPSVLDREPAAQKARLSNQGCRAIEQTAVPVATARPACRRASFYSLQESPSARGRTPDHNKEPMTHVRLQGAAALICGIWLPACAAAGFEDEQKWVSEPHHLSILLASTIEEGERAPSVGLDYEYRTSEFLGLGFLVERAFGDFDSTVVLAVADLHLTPQVSIQTGPGIDFIEGEQRTAYRLGVIYEFEREGYTVAPQLHYDWTSGEDALILGLALGVGF